MVDVEAQVGEADGPDQGAPLVMFPAVPSSIPAARAWVREELARRGCDEGGVDAAVLLVSELATNVVQHTASGRFGVCLDVAGDRIEIAVQDRDRSTAGALGVPVERDGWVEDGRGLEVVSAVSHAWGVVGTKDGKWVWCAYVADRPAAHPVEPEDPRPLG
jgi:anti-sigma regulatory factor (Ser/Thr protein kinase)